MSLGMLARLELVLLRGHKPPEVMADIRSARLGAESLLSGNESFVLYSIARAQRRLDGDMAEVGVYQGCSAKIISMASGGIPLHLFDTFQGLPEPDHHERDWMRPGDYASSLKSVESFLVEHKNVSFYPGLFSPERASPVSEKRFSFVHLDVDLKSSTLDSLRFFYPRLVRGGIIVTHDYSYFDGVKDAFGEFLSDKDEVLLELPTSQAMIVKL